jgi:hypothetical protein
VCGFGQEGFGIGQADGRLPWVHSHFLVLRATPAAGKGRRMPRLAKSASGVYGNSRLMAGGRFAIRPLARAARAGRRLPTFRSESAPQPTRTKTVVTGAGRSTTIGGCTPCPRSVSHCGAVAL